MSLKKILIVLPEAELILSSVVGSYKLFRASIQESGTDTELLIGGKTDKVLFLDDLFSITPNAHWSDVKKPDLIIIPAIISDLGEALQNNKDLVNWLVTQRRQGSEIASLCTGSFLLASSGLLDGKQSTTHWAYSQEFQRMFQNVKFQKNSIVTEDNGIFTSGGAFSFLNLIAYLIERYYGKEIAATLCKIFQIDQTRKSQDQFVIFSTQKDHDDENIKKAQEYIEKHYSLKISNKKIADIACMSERSMIRRFKSATGNTPVEYLQRVRIEAAKSLLSTTNKRIGEIQFTTGYNDPKTFRELFVRYTGMLPKEYQRKYQLST